MLHRITLLSKPDEINTHETNTTDLDTWLQAFYCSPTAVYQCKDWIIDRVYTGKLEPWSDAPPPLPPHYLPPLRYL